MKKLPNVEKAIVAEAKIVNYLLNLENENGQAKARFFSSFGFNPDEWEVMAIALKQHAINHDITRIEPRPPFGVHYVIEGSISTPDKRNPQIRVIWSIDEGKDTPG